MPSDFVQFIIYVLLGVIQGLTEVFPISSSAHLAFTSEILQDNLGTNSFGFENAVLLHVGTMFAIGFYYRVDIARLIRGFTSSLLLIAPGLGKANAKLVRPQPDWTALGLFVSVLFTAALGLTFEGIAKATFNEPSLISVLLIINGLFISVIARVRSGNRKMEDLVLPEFIIIGLAQGVAVLPGISRLGLTVSVALILGLTWFQALRLSFLLSLPIVLGATILELRHLVSDGSIVSINIVSMGAGILTACIVGYAGLKLLLRKGMNARTKLVIFGTYCILAGAFTSMYFMFLQ